MSEMTIDRACEILNDARYEDRDDWTPGTRCDLPVAIVTDEYKVAHTTYRIVPGDLAIKTAEGIEGRMQASAKDRIDSVIKGMKDHESLILSNEAGVATTFSVGALRAILATRAGIEPWPKTQELLVQLEDIEDDDRYQPDPGLLSAVRREHGMAYSPG